MRLSFMTISKETSGVIFAAIMNMRIRHLILMLSLLITACKMPQKKEDVTDISFYYIPEVNLGIGVYSNETEQTVRVFYKPNQVTEQRRGIPKDSFRQSTGISYRIDTGMVLSMTDYYRFPKMFLLSGYDGASPIEVRPQYGYVVIGETQQSFPEGVLFVNVSLPIGNDLLEYYDNSGERLEVHSVSKESLESRMAIDQEIGSYAPNRGFSSLPAFFDNNDPEADLDSQLTLYSQKCCFEYGGTTVETSPNIHREGWFYSQGFYINPKVPRYIFTGPDDFFCASGDIPIVVSDIIGMVVEKERPTDRVRYPKEPWVWIGWKDKNTLEFR